MNGEEQELQGLEETVGTAPLQGHTVPAWDWKATTTATAWSSGRWAAGRRLGLWCCREGPQGLLTTSALFWWGWAATQGLEQELDFFVACVYAHMHTHAHAC